MRGTRGGEPSSGLCGHPLRMISDTRTRQPRDGTMQCGNQPADISVIHRRFKDAARRVAHPVRTTPLLIKESKNVKKIARISPAPVDKGGPYQAASPAATGLGPANLCKRSASGTARP